jgi:hypothetical protein
MAVRPRSVAKIPPSSMIKRRLRTSSAVASSNETLMFEPSLVGFWQAAIRDTNDPEYNALVEAVKEPRRFGIELLYTDHEGSQRTITYFVVTPRGEDKWFCSEVRHWNLDRPDPRGV